jgi:hypothetical protein
MYSSSTLFVLSVGAGVDGFTYDRAIGEFVLTHPQVRQSPPPPPPLPPPLNLLLSRDVRIGSADICYLFYI